MYSLDYSDALLLYYLFFAKILPALVTYFFDKHFNIKIKFKSLSLFNACIQNISVKYAGYEITVSELGLKSKYLNSEYQKPLCVELEDVKIIQTYENDLEAVAQQRIWKKNLVETKNEAKYFGSVKKISWKFFSHIAQFLPPTVMIILKFLGIHIKNLSTTIQNKDKGPVASFAIPNLELMFDGCIIKDSRTLFIALALQHIRSKFFAYNKQNPSRKPHNACLAEIIVDCSLEIRVAWCNRSLRYEKLNLNVNNTQITFYGGLFDMIEHSMLHLRPTSTPVPSIESSLESTSTPTILPSVSKTVVDVEKIIETLTPELLVVNIDNTEVKSLNKQNSFHYHLLLQRLEVKAKSNSQPNIRVRLSNLRIYTPAFEALHSKELSIDVKSNGNIFIIGARIDTISLMYNHDDVFGWFRKIIMAGVKSNRKELILRAFRIMNEKTLEIFYSEFTQRLFRRIIVNLWVDLRSVSAVLQLDDQVSSINLSKIGFHLKQNGEKQRQLLYDDYAMNLLFQQRHWTCELISNEPICWYMGRKFDYVSSRKTYVRGSSLFLGSFLIRVSSIDEAFIKLDLHVNTLRTEYSQKLTSFSVKSVESFKEFIDLFSQLRSSKDEDKSIGKKPIAFEKLLQDIAIEAKISDISCFFINRHDVCVFLSLSTISSETSSTFNLESLEVSMVDFTKYESVYDLSEFSSTFISSRMLKLSLIMASDEQPQVGVDFAEKLECSWNAHFLRHLLSLARDFHRFKKKIEDALGIQSDNKSLLPRSLPVGLDIKKLRNIRVKHSDVNVDKLILLINELSGENLFFYHYFH